MSLLNSSLAAPGDPAAGQIVRRHLHRDLVAREDPDEIHTQLSGYVRQNDMAASDIDVEHRVRQRFHHRTFQFNDVVLRQRAYLLFLPAQPSRLQPALF